MTPEQLLLISNLKILTQIKQGQRIQIFRNKYQIIDIGFINSILSSFTRRLWNEDRWSNLNDIRELLNNGLYIINDNDYTRKNIPLILNKIPEGLNNLKSTYIYDHSFCSNIDTLNDWIVMELEKINNNNISIKNKK